MATYAIGDIHGCFETLEALLRRIGFDPRHDRLWLTGDLVNTGPRSLDVLRWARGLDDRVTVVLGNHDLKLLGAAAGFPVAKRSDTLREVLDAPDGPALCAWLRGRPLLHAEGSFILVHAGLLPAWDVETAARCARELEGLLARGDAPALFEDLYHKTHNRWSGALPEGARRSLALNAFTRMRTCTEDGDLRWGFSGELDDLPRGHVPWFRVANRRAVDRTIIFGHWSAIGYVHEGNVHALDSGCAWGRALTALRLDDMRVFQERAHEPAAGGAEA